MSADWISSRDLLIPSASMLSFGCEFLRCLKVTGVPFIVVSVEIISRVVPGVSPVMLLSTPIILLTTLTYPHSVFQQKQF